MHNEHLRILKDYVEGRLSHSGWREWWATHSIEVEEQCDRFTFLRLKRRGYGGAVAVLEERGIPFQPVEGFCHQCGEPLFTAMPGKTTVKDIRAFAEASRVADREHIRRDGWIHPGQYCLNGCTTVLWNIKRDDHDG